MAPKSATPKPIPAKGKPAATKAVNTPIKKKPKPPTAKPCQSTVKKSPMAKKKCVQTPGSTKKLWRRAPPPAHSGVPVPEKMRALLDKRLPALDDSL